MPGSVGEKWSTFQHRLGGMNETPCPAPLCGRFDPRSVRLRRRSVGRRLQREPVPGPAVLVSGSVPPRSERTAPTPATTSRALRFTSHRPGPAAGGLTSITSRLPQDPPKPPKQDGTGGTWDFQLRATFWLSITMCDTESSPNYTKSCKPNSDANARFRSNDPRSPQLHREVARGTPSWNSSSTQPGWVPQFDGFGCTATKWCANMTIDSLSDQDNTGIAPEQRLSRGTTSSVGEEPINWAYITKSGCLPGAGQSAGPSRTTRT